MSEESKVYKFEEVSKHTERDDLWMAIHGIVYDVTKFIDEHPGGEEVLFDVGGLDATDAFEDVGHSDDARKILEPLKIGELDPSEKPSSAKSLSTSESSTSSSGANYFQIVAAVVALAAIIFYTLSQKSA
ncbi:hypothetical protein V1511DRAFT_243739 [Dipodascopsis uninucleata]